MIKIPNYKRKSNKKKCPKCGKFNTLWIKGTHEPITGGSKEIEYCTKCSYHRSLGLKHRYSKGRRWLTKKGSTSRYIYRNSSRHGILTIFPSKKKNPYKSMEGFM